MSNHKQSSPKIAQLASDTLRDPNSSATAKSLAGSVIAQSSTGKQTGAGMEDLASKVLLSTKYSDDTRSLSGSVLAQASKER